MFGIVGMKTGDLYLSSGKIFNPRLGLLTCAEWLRWPR